MKDRIPTPHKPAKPPEPDRRRECGKQSSSRAPSVNRTWCSIPSMSVWIISAFLLSCISSTRAQAATTGVNGYNITALPSLVTLTGSNTSNSSTTTVTVPSSEANLTYVTLNLCSLASSNGTYSPSIWLTNSTSISALGISTVLNYIGSSRPGVLWQKDRSTGLVQDGRYNQMIAVNEDDVHQVLDGTSDGIQQQMGKSGNAFIWNLQTWKGYGNWTGIGTDGVWLEVDSMIEGLDMEIGVDTDGPIHTISPLLPMFGDTTATQSLILSPILASTNISQPTYPNYRISSPYPINATAPSNLTTMRVVIIPTSESPDTASETNLSLGNSMCAVMRAENRTGSLAKNRASSTDGEKTKLSLDQRPEGWRWGFVTGTLSAETNYTAWTVEQGTGTYANLHHRGAMSQRIMFRTKEDTFPCPLVHSLALCPSIAYAAALNPDLVTESTGNATDLPASVSHTLVSSLNAFSSSILAQACGRDLFSPVWTCQDCFDEYREWLCRTVLPQCASSSGDATKQKIVNRTPDSPSAAHVATPSYSYTQLLPCLSNCRRVDRKCPVNLQFRCPLRAKTANMTYAYHGQDEEDKGRGEGEDDGGIDEWGNRWCNGGLPG